MSSVSNMIRFVLDDEVCEICFNDKSSFSPTTTVLNFLRSLHFHKGVKEGCGEGDCGACTVVIAEENNNKLIYKAIDSCIMLLPALQGKQLITVEDLAQKKNNITVLHPVQKAIVENNGTQCGYCTPGFVMSLFALYKNDYKPTREIVLDAFSGNLCRCTGYEPIINAAMEVCSSKKKDRFDEREKDVIEKLKQIKQSTKTIEIETANQKYFKPFTFAEAKQLKSKYPDSLIISGATDVALRVTKKHELIPLIIDFSDIDELKQYQIKKNEIIFGAGMTLESVKEISKKELPALHEMLCVFGSKQIRNIATLGGNVGSASPIGDTLPVLIACDASVVLESVNKSREFKIVDFIKSYRQTQCLPNEFISKIIIPRSGSDVTIKSYKISKRKTLDISTVSACFRLKRSKENKVSEIAIVYGGMAATTKHAVKAEAFLLGRTWTEKNIIQAIERIKEEFKPLSDARAGEEYRRIAAGNLLMKFFNDIK